MDRFQYLGLLALCLVATMPLEFVLGARVYRRTLRLAVTLAVVAVSFSAFDAASIAMGWWKYAKAYTTGILLPGRLPIEEFAFFLVIPVCSILTYEAIGRVHRLYRRRQEAGR
ncbi:MAG: lycopene cyclase domain-containing protein [Actinomycetota bacterium]|nr:lycopene cyclase domain-containing protein [Actinomycetota bacterium]